MIQAATVVGYLALALLGHGLLWVGIVNRLHSWAGPRKLVDGATLACVAAFAAIPLSIAWSLLDDPTIILSAPLESLTGAYSGGCALFGCAMLVVKPVGENRRYDRSVMPYWEAERHDLAAAGSELLQTPRARLLGRIPLNESLQLSVDRRTLRIARLPAKLDGFRICHLTDLHLTGAIGREYFERLVELVNRAAPDAVCVTGDIIEHEPCRPWLADVLGQLAAPQGVYFILGNHDLFIDAERTCQDLVGAGWVCVSGAWTQAVWRDATVQIGGNELPWRAAGGDLLAPPPRATSELRILLAHSPDQFQQGVDADADLLLAGHTHGGQVQLPWLGVIASPSRYGAKYACGVFRRGQTVMHVSRGIGGKNPVRWRCPPEAAILQLTGEGEQGDPS